MKTFWDDPYKYINFRNGAIIGAGLGLSVIVRALFDPDLSKIPTDKLFLYGGGLVVYTTMAGGIIGKTCQYAHRPGSLLGTRISNTIANSIDRLFEK